MGHPGKCNDIACVILFFLVFAGFVVLMVMNLEHIDFNSSGGAINAQPASESATNDDGYSISDMLDDLGGIVGDVIYVVGITTAFAFVWAFFWLFLAYSLGKYLIYVSIVFTIIIMIIYAGVLAFTSGIIWGGMVFLFAIFFAYYFYRYRKRIPFTAFMIKTVTGLMKRYPATIGVAAMLLIVSIIWFAIWLVAALGVSLNTDYGISLKYLIFVFFLFVHYWVTQVLKNVVHVTVSGTFGHYFFSGGMARNPTVKSLKRALTYSLGSIIFGSLIVAVLKTIKAIVRMADNGENGMARACVMCILNCIDNLLQYFNSYVYIFVSLFGVSYIEGAKATYSLLFTHGFEGILNDNLTSTVTFMGSLIGAGCSFGVGALAGYLLIDKEWWLAIGFFGLVIGFTLTQMVMEILESGVSALFVAIAKRPTVFRRDFPHIYDVFNNYVGGRSPSSSSA